MVVHAGELLAFPDRVEGAAIEVAAQLLAMAGPDRVTITGVVKDLAIGSGLDLRPGPAAAAAVDVGPVQLYLVPV